MTTSTEPVPSPQPGDIRFVQLFGRTRDDGGVELGHSEPKTIVPAFPERVDVDGSLYVLSHVTENDGPWRATAPADHPGLRIVWGNYSPAPLNVAARSAEPVFPAERWHVSGLDLWSGPEGGPSTYELAGATWSLEFEEPGSGDFAHLVLSCYV